MGWISKDPALKIPTEVIETKCPSTGKCFNKFGGTRIRLYPIPIKWESLVLGTQAWIILQTPQIMPMCRQVWELVLWNPMPGFKESARSMDTDRGKSNIFREGKKKKERNQVAIHTHTHTHILIYMWMHRNASRIWSINCKVAKVFSLAHGRCSINGGYYFHVRPSFGSLLE